MPTVPDAPVRAANAARNAEASRARFVRWRPARTATWSVLDPLVAPGARVAVVGAGNGHDLPLGRLARRAGAVDLVDVDPRVVHATARGSRHRHVRGVVEDVTAGAADAIVRTTVSTDRDAWPDAAELVAPARGPIGRAPYDVVVADLVLTQLVYPALRDAEPPRGTTGAALARFGQPLTDAVVARLAASAPGGTVVVLHDLLGWWAGREQPFALEDVLTLAESDPDAALALAETGTTPTGCDPRGALRRAGLEPGTPRFWRWPFAPGADYLVCATVAAVPA